MEEYKIATDVIKFGAVALSTLNAVGFFVKVCLEQDLPTDRASDKRSLGSALYYATVPGREFAYLFKAK